VNYRTVYDVIDAPALPTHTEGLVFLGGALFFTTVWVTLTHCIRRTNPERELRVWPGLVVGLLLVGVGVLQVVTGTYPVYRDQRQCREWLRAGRHDTVEGVVADFRRDAGKNPHYHFRVGDVRFTYWPLRQETGGFVGNFTAPGTDDLKLRDGLRVRVTHRDGRILRIEAAE
jgi:hypothetical protein